ncbi:MAG: hypothetical protein AAFY71_27960 [Bacteroidota bacterium]
MKVVLPESEQSLFHYDQSGYPIQEDYYFEKIDSGLYRTEIRDQREYYHSNSYAMCMDTIPKVFKEKILTPPASLEGVAWPGFGVHDSNDVEAVGGILDTSYLDLERDQLVKEYLIKSGYSQKVIHRENKNGEVVEVEGFFSTGLRTYLKRRIQTENGFEGQLISETEGGDYIRSIKYDSLGYRYFEGYEYYPKDSTKKQLRIARRYSDYKLYVYDGDYYLQAVLHYMKGKIVESKEYEYDENKNLLKETYNSPWGDVQIMKFIYTYYE